MEKDDGKKKKPNRNPTLSCWSEQGSKNTSNAREPFPATSANCLAQKHLGAWSAPACCSHRCEPRSVANPGRATLPSPAVPTDARTRSAFPPRSPPCFRFCLRWEKNLKIRKKSGKTKGRQGKVSFHLLCFPEHVLLRVWTGSSEARSTSLSPAAPSQPSLMPHSLSAPSSCFLSRMCLGTFSAN